MDFTQIKEINPSSLRLFALFYGYKKKQFSSSSILHLFVDIQKPKDDIQKAIITHLPFDDINRIISQSILKEAHKKSFFLYSLFVGVVLFLLWFFLGNIGITISLICFEPNIQKRILNFFSERLLTYYKKDFFDFLDKTIW